ncbi:UbiA family prenyltransferase [Desulfoluna spongiiphila]|uniref:UbiA family prenyltransferase n=1 Tax=Desulfoluna spongiiphila TaxID=419481 RepID=UPI0012529FF6|nr:UbiA family prenyltransferase [Desulfoluna spongiiphila]VVS94752.1 consensus disorder prediction [Desulfoluna spongiiphila]
MSDRRACDRTQGTGRSGFNHEMEMDVADTKPSPRASPKGRAFSFFLLSKTFLSAHIGLAAAAGCLFHAEGNVVQAVMAWCGVTLTAMAGALVNNIQDRLQDQEITRTRWRRKALESAGVLTLLKGAGLMAVLGLMLVVDAADGLWPAAMVLTGLFFYNVVYTPLKKKSHLALLPGSLCGMAALLAGWMVSGGSPMDREALSAALVVGVWQIPHSMIQNLKHADELRKSDQPSITKLFKDPELAFVTLMWVMLYNLSLYHLIFMADFSDWALLLLFTNAGFLTPLFAHTLFVTKKPGLAFGFLNLSLVAYFIALMIP